MRGESRHAPSRPRRAGTRRGQDASANGEHGAGRQAIASDEAEKLAGLLGPVIAAAGMDLEAIRITRAGRRRLLRVVVDADGGAGLDDIAEVSRAISARLDDGGAMGDFPYTLEVSSPGVDRPLTEPRHWRRAQGRLVAVALTGRGREAPPDREPATVQGRVVKASDHGVVLDVDGSRRDFAYGDLGPGRVQVEFAKPGDGADGEGTVRKAGAGDGGSLDGH